MSMTFTFPGKMGDALHQWPVAYHWAKKTGEKFDAWLDVGTCGPLVPLLEAQPCVNQVKLIEGVENYSCGGQPWHFDLPTSAHQDRTIVHMGLRGFPVRQLTLECMNQTKLNLSVKPDVLANEPSLKVETSGKKNRLILHGMPVCPHTHNTPVFWKFLSGIRGELEKLFDEIVFVGDERDREIGTRTYPDWTEFADDGDFMKLANYLGASRAMIGCGSAPVVLAGLLKVPAIRVHDVIANDAPKVIWTNLGENQLNEPEVDLRASWPKWRDRWLNSAVDSMPERA